jgi:hypothetical protein
LIEFPVAVVAALLLLVASVDLFKFRHDDRAVAAAATAVAEGDSEAVAELPDAFRSHTTATHVCVARSGRSMSGLLSRMLDDVEHRAIEPRSNSSLTLKRVAADDEGDWAWCPSESD